MPCAQRPQRAQLSQLPSLCTQFQQPAQYVIPPPPPPRPRSLQIVPPFPQQPSGRPASLQQPQQPSQRQSSCSPPLPPPPPPPPKQQPCPQQRAYFPPQARPSAPPHYECYRPRHSVGPTASPPPPPPPKPPKPPQYDEAARRRTVQLQDSRRTASGPPAPAFDQRQSRMLQQRVSMSDLERPAASPARRAASDPMRRPQPGVAAAAARSEPSVPRRPCEKALPSPLRIAQPDSLSRGMANVKRNRQTAPANKYVSQQDPHRRSQYFAFHPAQQKSNEIDEIAAMLQAEIDDIEARNADGVARQPEMQMVEARDIDDMERQFLGPAMLQKACAFVPGTPRWSAPPKRSVSTPVEMKPWTPPVETKPSTPPGPPASPAASLHRSDGRDVTPRTSKYFVHPVQPAKTKMRLPTIITNTATVAAHSAAFHRVQAAAPRTPSPEPPELSPVVLLPLTPTSPATPETETTTEQTAAAIKPDELKLFNEIRRMLTFKARIVRDQDEDEDEDEYTDEFDEVLEAYTGGVDAGIARIGTVRR